MQDLDGDNDVPDSHVHVQTRSTNNLQAARRRAAQQSGYNSAHTRSQLISLFQERTQGEKTPHDWQLDVAEALLLGVGVFARWK